MLVVMLYIVIVIGNYIVIVISLKKITNPHNS